MRRNNNSGVVDESAEGLYAGEVAKGRGQWCHVRGNVESLLTHYYVIGSGFWDPLWF